MTTQMLIYETAVPAQVQEPQFERRLLHRQALEVLHDGHVCLRP